MSASLIFTYFFLNLIGAIYELIRSMFHMVGHSKNEAVKQFYAALNSPSKFVVHLFTFAFNILLWAPIKFGLSLRSKAR